MKLVTPHAAYEQSFLEAEKEFEVSGDNIFDVEIPRHSNLKEYIDLLAAHARGENLPTGWVPYSIFWIIDNEEFIGHVSIRHELNNHLRTIGGHIGYVIRPTKRRQGYGTQALKLALKKAREMGISEVLVTCDETNIPSKKIIEINGGIFEKATDQGYTLPRKLLYWISH